MEKQKKRQYKNGVQETLKFTDEDLILNRQGHLSEGQKLEQAKQLSSDMKIMLLPALFILIFGFGLIGEGERVYLVISIVLLCLGAFAAFQMRQDLQKSLNLNRPVQMAEVKLSLKPYNSRYASVTVTSNVQNFSIPMESYQILKDTGAEDKIWLIYYLTDPKRIIAIEELIPEPI